MIDTVKAMLQWAEFQLEAGGRKASVGVQLSSFDFGMRQEILCRKVEHRG